MNDRAATLVETEARDAPAASQAIRVPRGNGMKFTYAGGSRPLEGFTIQRGVGIGGFGEVYFAVSDAGKEVALKRIQRNLEIELRGVTQCLNLKHPNLVALYDIKHDEQENAWVVMEFLTGRSLKETLDTRPQGMSPEEAIRWFTGAAEGTAYLHEQGIVHRDLKPGNLFEDRGTVKIGDYGLSKLIAGSRRSGQTESVGTFHYMAPEIGKGSYGKEIDIYALGIMLYEMLTGKVPFDGESSHEIIMRHLTETPDLEKLPPRFREGVGRALEKDPELRFRDAREMLAAIKNPAVVTASIAPSAATQATIGSSPRYAPPADFARDPALRGTPIVTAELVSSQPSEPIAHFIGRTAGSITSWCDRTGLGASFRVLLVLSAVLIAWQMPRTMFPLLMLSAFAYAVYALGWTVVTSLRESHFPPPPPQRGLRFRTWQELARDRLRSKPFSQRWGEWLASLLSAAGLNAILALMMLAIADRLEGTLESLSLFAWLASSATLGTWGVLTVGKYCEGSESDAVRRRMVMLALGITWGAMVFSTAQWLMIDMSIASVTTSHSKTLYTQSGTPLAPLFVLFGGAIFLVPRWWKQTDPLRRSRVSFTAVAGGLLASFVLQLFWRFPQPWGYMLPAMISLATQLSASWLLPHEREVVKREFRGGPLRA